MTNENLLYKNPEFLKIKSIIWKEITCDCEAKIKSEPLLKNFFELFILKFDSFQPALISYLTKLLSNDYSVEYELRKVISDCYNKNPYICDLAICSGGLTLFEACALGVPAIALPQNKHQQKNILSY